jgi:hypothetical protein
MLTFIFASALKSSSIIEGSTLVVTLLRDDSIIYASGALLHTSSIVTDGSNTGLEVDTASASGALLQASNNLADGSNKLLEVDIESTGTALLHASSNLAECSKTCNLADGNNTLLGVGSVSTSGTLLEVITNVLEVDAAFASDTGFEEFLDASNISEFQFLYFR